MPFVVQVKLYLSTGVLSVCLSLLFKFSPGNWLEYRIWRYYNIYNMSFSSVTSGYFPIHIQFPTGYFTGFLVSKRISGLGPRSDIRLNLNSVHSYRNCVLPRVTLSLVPSDTSMAETERTPQSPGLDRYGDRFRSSCKQFVS